MEDSLADAMKQMAELVTLKPRASRRLQIRRQENENGNDISPVILSKNPFSNESSRILFDSIDELRRRGAGQDLDLPQLVIVGKQSAGKSSLLQSLTDIPFPVGDALCTQFALRIVSRRTAPGTPEMIQASIESGDVNPFSIHDDDSRTNSFVRAIPTLTAEAFEGVINQAKEAMGICSPLTSEDKNYSSKVLKIELSGPERSHFAILDLPGVFSSLRTGVSGREREGVLSIVKAYMRKPENIIICVADTVGDMQNEVILDLASDVDSSRLVGVLTKCDKADNKEDKVQFVLDGDGFPGKHVRWHVVQNRGPNAPPNFDRAKEENATFNKAPWSKIPAEQRGISSLKQYLATILCKRIRDTFPSMLSIVTNKLRDEKNHRRSLGESRGDHPQRLAYLVAISQRYQDLANKSLSTPDALPDASMKLRGQSKKATQNFVEEMTTNGHFYNFLEIGKSVEVPVEVKSEAESEDYIPPTQYPNPSRQQPLTPSPSPSPTKRTKPITVKPTKTQTHPLYQEIRSQIHENLGEELPGVLNPAVIRPLWRKQTCKWLDISSNHLLSLIKLTTAVSFRLFHQACLDIGATDRTRLGLQKCFRDFETSSRDKVISQLRVSCDRNSDMALQTSDPEFDAKVRNARQVRFAQALDRYTVSNPWPQPGFEKCAVIDNARLSALFNELHPHGTRSQNVEDEIHDLLKAYYEITMQNFIYDITHNINEPFLLSKDGPLLGLSTDFVLALSEEEVMELAGDEEVDLVARRESEGRIKRLEDAVGIARSALGRTGGVVEVD